MSRELPFVKMHGAGNDFVVLDGIRDELPPLEPLARRLADRHCGIGFDQLLVVRPSREADFRMEIYNADGSQVEMCANGIRAFFKYLRDRGHTAADEVAGRDPRGGGRAALGGCGPRARRDGPADPRARQDPDAARERRRPGARRPARGRRAAAAAQLGLDGKPARGALRGRRRRRAGREPRPPPRAPRRVPEPRERRVRRARLPGARAPAHLGARHGRDPRVRERRLRGGGGVHPAGLVRPVAHGRAPGRRAPDRVERAGCAASS